MNRKGPDIAGWTMVAPDNRLCSGQVTKWTYQGKTSLPFRAIIFRPVKDSDTSFTIVGINEIPKDAADTNVVYKVPEDDRITVQEGDVIGWSFEGGVITWNPGGATKVRWVGGYLNARLVVTDREVDINTGVEAREYSILATVESSDSGKIFT